jgi:DNA polymerase-3 subunit beta
MKIRVNREEFIKLLSNLSVVVKENSIRPVISGTKLETKDGMAVFTGSNLEFSYISSIPAQIESEGVTVFRIPLILEYIKLLDEENLDITVSEGKLLIHRAEFSILDWEDYPEIQQPESENIFEIESQNILSAFEKVKFSAFPTTDNLAINCIRMACDNNSLNMISTDSYRLTKYSLNTQCKTDSEVSIPLESINIICKLLKDSEENSSFGVKNGILTIKKGNSFMSTRLIELPFPDYKAIFKNMSYTKNIELNTADFKGSIKKVLTVAKRNIETKNGAIFEFKGNRLISTVSSGSAKTVQKVDTIKDGDDFKASLNVKFIYDFLVNIQKNIIIKATNSSSMFIMEELGNENYKYILMPLALRD